MVVKGKLNNSRPVAQVNKDERTEVALLLYPAADNGGFADILCAERTAVSGPFESFHGIHLFTPLKISFCS